MISRWGAGPFILMYHSIADGSEDAYAVSPDKFQDQVTWLVDHGFELVPLALIVNLLKNGDYLSLKRKVTFTFDDGYNDFLTTALPILLNHKAPATVFIVTGMLGEKASWSSNSENVQLMTEDEVRYIKAQGISLGSHTTTHANLTLLDHKTVKRQLTDSREKISHLGESYYAISYPWGQWTSQILGAVKASGYECAVIVGGEMCPGRIDIYHLPRMTMRADMDLKSFRALFDRRVVKNVRKVGHALKRCFSS